jgi:hypothetical protein
VLLGRRLFRLRDRDGGLLVEGASGDFEDDAIRLDGAALGADGASRGRGGLTCGGLSTRRRDLLDDRLRGAGDDGKREQNRNRQKLLHSLLFHPAFGDSPRLPAQQIAADVHLHRKSHPVEATLVEF